MFRESEEQQSVIMNKTKFGVEKTTPKLISELKILFSYWSVN